MRAGYIFAFLASLLAIAASSHAQLQDRSAEAPVRVTVAQNQDGSRTSYAYDQPNRKAVASTMAEDGKLLSKIHYDLDEQGRFKAGEVYDGKGELRFKTEYKYDPKGRLESETQLTRDGSVRHKLVYSYNDMGKQTGYAVYDASGKLLGRSNVTSPQSASSKK
ncbi:MAG: hypothetical protein LC642_06445 [Verrucomicrobiaceae bacterium]|nr:hypothetical protein [Verrucomicrobiaceae bacterium]